LIVPCGIADRAVTSLEQLGWNGRMDEVEEVLTRHFSAVFERAPVAHDLP